jgi:tetratricopeptide (TPR) repeat protein
VVENNRRVVAKHELMCAVWPDTFVEENNLTQSISMLRKALGESRKDHKFIVTIQGRGYRFVAGVKEIFYESSDVVVVARTQARTLFAGQEVAGQSKTRGNIARLFVTRLSLRTRLVVGLIWFISVCTGLYLWGVNGMKPGVSPTEQSNLVIPFKYLYDRKNPQAYQAYIKGRHFWNKRTEAGLSKAVRYFEQAIHLDQNYALAYTGLADSYLMSAMYGYALAPGDAIQMAKTAALKALALDETLAEAHTSLAAFLESAGRDLPGAEREYKKALELNPNYATGRQWYGEFLRSTGRVDEALVQLKLAQELDPLSPIMNSSLGVSYYYARQYDLVIEQNRKALEIDPNFTPAHFGLGLAFEQKGMYQAAIAELQRAKELSNDGEPMVAALGHAYAKSGDRARALQVFKELKEKRKSVSAYNLALIHIAFGEKTKALPLLQRAREEALYQMKLRLDPRLDDLRTDSAFAEVFKS